MTMGNMDSHIQNPVWRKGLPRLVEVEAPGAGKEWAIQVPTVPEALWWEVLAIRFRLATSAVVGSRLPLVAASTTKERTEVGALGGPLTYWCSMFAGAGQGASLTSDYWLGKGLGTALSLGPVNFTAWPVDLFLQPGHYVRSHTLVIDPADQYSGIQLLVQELVYVPPVDYISGALSLAADRIIAAVKANSGCGCPLVVGEAVGSPTE